MALGVRPSTPPGILPSATAPDQAANGPASPPGTPTGLKPAPPGRSWSLSAWLFAREGGSAALAPGGTLGGSQAGLRATYRLGRAPIAASLRLTAPLRRPAGAEAAAGLDWQPLRRAPLHLLVERRQKLGREGRNAFGATLYGGVDEVRLGPLRLDGYGQAGIVGLAKRDLFADGAMHAALPIGDGVRVGGGAWAAAQPNLSRVDVGPHAELRLPVAGGGRLSADWRFRIAGNARPGSGPAVTLAADF